MVRKQLEFRTKNGNAYTYDDTTGAVIHENTKTAKAVSKKAIPDYMLKYEQSNNKRSGLVTSQIDRYLKQNGFQQLTLVVTQRCNLRCKYCIFSDQYFHTRLRKPIDMSLNVAVSALKYYFENFKRVKYLNPNAKPTIGFYGGEPLLKNDLIVEITRLARELWDGIIHFNLTTNATLLSKQVIDFLRKEDFFLSISLDGPPSEHDKNRIYPGGEGTYNDILANLQNLDKAYKTANCNLLVLYDVSTNFDRMTNFFESNQDRLPTIGRVASISPIFTKWYDQYSQNDWLEFRKKLTKHKNNYISKLENGEAIPIFYDALFGPNYRRILTRPQNIPYRPSFLPYTSTCVPGERIAVTPDGRFHCCEKINGHYPIGNIQEGLDIQRIARLITKYRRQITDECEECPITRLCPVCFAMVGGKHKFKRTSPDMCKTFQKTVQKRFGELWTMFENGITPSDILGKRSKGIKDAQCNYEQIKEL